MKVKWRLRYDFTLSSCSSYAHFSCFFLWISIKHRNVTQMPVAEYWASRLFAWKLLKKVRSMGWQMIKSQTLNYYFLSVKGFDHITKSCGYEGSLSRPCDSFQSAESCSLCDSNLCNSSNTKQVNNTWFFIAFTLAAKKLMFWSVKISKRVSELKEH